ncbi:MAG: D-alanine--D-alanine ligase [Candidatus Lambdaproteobacteria bacterium]|nr:D-alanine--D-alanine ligase [Candidatus Lambdaproteobacteria bacterium]
MAKPTARGRSVQRGRGAEPRVPAPRVKSQRGGGPRIVVLHGAVPADAPADEQDVLAEVDAVCAGLVRLGYAAQPLPLTLDLEAARRKLARHPPALVFNLVESIAGSGRLLFLAPALLEELRLPYTGVPLDGIYQTSNKPVAKRLMGLAGIPTPPVAERAADAGAGRWIVKSVWEHASIGLDDGSVVEGGRALAAALAGRRARYGGEWFAEGYIEGREFNLALLAQPDGVRVLPAAEMRFEGWAPDRPRIVGYRAKWHPEAPEYRGTVRAFADLGAEGPLLAELEALALRCWRLFRLRGYARVDFRVDEAGRPWVLEVNANPCIAPDAGFAAALAQAGIAFDQALAWIVADALQPRSGG